MICDGNPQPITTVIIALDVDTFTQIDTTVTNIFGHYSLTVPDDTTVLLIAIPSSGGQVNGFQLHQYLVDTRATQITSGIRNIDFVTAPAYQLVLTGYDDSGLVGETGYFQLFLTDMDETALPIFSFGVRNEALSVTVPGFNILPGNPVIIFLQWELPYAGRIMVRMDNHGLGFSGTEQGVRFIHVNQEIAVWAIFRLETHIAAAPEYVSTVDAEEKLAEARNAFDLGDFAEAAGLAVVATEDLALTISEAGIERFRKGDLQVHVTDSKGIPVRNAVVTITQQNRDFLFGIFDQYADVGADIYSRAFEDGFNFFTAGFYWTESEPENNAYQWDFLDHEVGILEMDQLGFAIKGHPLIWLIEYVIPAYMQQINFVELEEEIQEHITAMVSRYVDIVGIWDVINEAHGWPSAGGLSREQITSITLDAVDLVHTIDPDAVSIVNSSFDWFGQSIFVELYEPDHDEFFTQSVPDYFQDLLSEGAAIDVLGQQMYNGGCVTVFVDWGLSDRAVSVATYDLATLREILDQLNDFGMPFHVTENSIPSAMVADCPNMSYWRAPWSESQQAEYLEAFYTLVFGTEMAGAVTWWDMIDEWSFIKYGGLYDEDNQPKEAYNRFVELLSRWSSHESVDTDCEGTVQQRVFGGDYLISATFGGHYSEKTAHIHEQSSLSVDLVLEDFTVDMTPGDLNKDGAVTVSDAVILGNYLAGNLPHCEPPFLAPMCAADLNEDENVNTSDWMIVSNLLADNLTF